MSGMNFGEPSGGGFIEQHFDFKQCQRSNGSIYGVPDTSDCAMKGAKEVKSSTGDGPLLQLRAQMAKSPRKFDEEVLSKLGRDGLEKLSAGLSSSKDPVDKQIKALTDARLQKMKSEEKPTLTPKSQKAFRGNAVAYGNWFKQNGYNNPEIRGQMAAINDMMRQRGEITQAEFDKVASDLKSRGQRWLDAYHRLKVRGRELKVPARPRTTTESQADKDRRDRADARSFWNTVDARKKRGAAWEDLD